MSCVGCCRGAECVGACVVGCAAGRVAGGACLGRGAYGRRLGLGGGRGGVGVGCCRASRETSILFFWQRSLKPLPPLMAGLVPVDEDDATVMALDDTCFKHSYYI